LLVYISTNQKYPLIASNSVAATPSSSRNGSEFGRFMAIAPDRCGALWPRCNPAASSPHALVRRDGRHYRPAPG
jgi:hypothetical protein